MTEEKRVIEAAELQAAITAILDTLEGKDPRVAGTCLSAAIATLGCQHRMPKVAVQIATMETIDQVWGMLEAPEPEEEQKAN